MVKTDKIKRYGPYKLPRGHLFFIDLNEVTGDRRTVLLHRELMEQHLGRALTDQEVVHHIDEDPANNAVNNLEVMAKGDHIAMHQYVPPLALQCAGCRTFFFRAGLLERRRVSQRRGGPYCGKVCVGLYARRDALTARAGHAG